MTNVKNPEIEVIGQEKPRHVIPLREYRKYNDSVKEAFFFHLYEERLSLRKAAAKVKVPPSTAQGWKKKFKDGEDVFKRKKGSGRPEGRPAILNEDYQKHLIELIDNNPSLVLDKMMESLTSRFEDFEISKTTLYNFREIVCRNFKKEKTGLRRPRRTEPSKTRKVGSVTTPVANKDKGGIVTGHYFNFVAATLDVFDPHEQLKGCYIVMDNAPIHTYLDIQKCIDQRSYGCIYLPPYAPELNPMEQFWSVCKSKLKRERLLKEETLLSRIAEACNNTCLSDLQGFCRYSVSKFQDCLEGKPL
ncbi:hypothetical protein G6F56_007469 [Rhizopus delemar]|nr:hypothetical protein G6F56_007469 [Rhizopus delemar]